MTFYESPDRWKRKKRQKKFGYSNSTDVPFQTIPTMISSTLDHALYKGAIFIMSKKRLKKSLGVITLKEKFEYKIRRSSKTRFYASCKHIGCNFLLRAIGIQGGIVNCW